MKRNRGLSLIELLVSALLMMLAIGVVARAFSAGLIFEDKSAKHRSTTAERLWFEDQLNTLVSGATLKGSVAYFISPIPASVNTPALTSAKSSSLGAGSDSLVLTNASLPLPIRALTGKASDFETLNKQIGPIGGTAEVGLSMTPVGDPKGLKGLFLRQQIPADTDNQQGGEETVLGKGVQDVRFQFYNGTQWQDTWDSGGADKGKLPKTVRVRYQLADESDPREVLIRLPLSDASSDGNNSSGQPNTPPTGTPPAFPGGPPAGGAPQ